MMRVGSRLLAILLLGVMSVACGHYEYRIPPATVYIPFNTVGDWNTHGIAGAYTYKIFVKERQIPANFPYTALSETGFGGVLLTADMHGNFIAYDLACPVEMRRDVRLAVDAEKFVARCDKCGSTFDVFDNYGIPLSGPAHQYDYRLTRYYVGPGGNGEYMIVR
ncbi:MAG: hypothetical protein J1E84_05675 [Muribaculaceae bacterium]|nr:hypothetical protein [Muribaculaceae bacterium]